MNNARCLSTSWLPCIFTVIKIPLRCFPLERKRRSWRNDKLKNAFFQHLLSSLFARKTIFSFFSACHELYDSVIQLNAKNKTALMRRVNDKNFYRKDINSPILWRSFFSSANLFQPSRYLRWKVALVIERITRKLHATKKLVSRLLVFEQNIPGKKLSFSISSRAR